MATELQELIQNALESVVRERQDHIAGSIAYGRLNGAAGNLERAIAQLEQDQASAVEQLESLVRYDVSYGLNDAGDRRDRVSFGCDVDGEYVRLVDVRALLATQPEPDDPLDTLLPCDIEFGSGKIAKGCKLRTLVARAKALYELCGAYGPKSIQYDIEHPNDGLNADPRLIPATIDNPAQAWTAPAVADGMPPLPKPSEEMRAYWKCDSCDGRGHDGEMHSQGYFQSPEPGQCHDCKGSGMTQVDAYAPWEVQEIARAYGQECARKAIAAIPASVPQGWKLVPAEPTREMAEAFGNELEGACGSYFDWEYGGGAGYRAMLAVAPIPPAAQAGEDARYAKLGRVAMLFVDRAGDPHPGIDDAERICREFHATMSDAIDAIDAAMAKEKP